MPRPVIEKALHLFPNTNFVNAYGLTETSSTISVLGPEDHRNALESQEEPIRRRLSSAGKPLPNLEVSSEMKKEKFLRPEHLEKFGSGANRYLESTLDMEQS